MSLEEKNKLEYKTVVFIGGGMMTEAILKGILDAGIINPQDIIISEPVFERQIYLARNYGIEPFFDNKKAVKKADVIILAVKPGKMGEVLKEIAPKLTEDKLLISIAAGVSLEKIGDHLGGGNFRVIRVMPNICATVGEAMTGICADSPYTDREGKVKRASDEDLAITKEIFNSCGIAAVIENEYLMHIITALSGSGPAYGFLVMESLANAGVREGLYFKDAVKIAAQTMLGAAIMVLETGKHPAELKDMVTSPAGTTAEGLYALEECGVRAAFMEAVEKATEKSKNLGNKKRK